MSLKIELHFFLLILLKSARTFNLNRSLSSECCCGKPVEKIIHHFASVYRHKLLPPSKNFPTTIRLEMHILDISSFNDTSGEFVVEMFYSQLWLDPDLNFQNLSQCRENVTLDPSFLEEVWSPKVCLSNARFSYVHNSPTQNMFVILYENGTLWVNYRMQVTVPCEVDLRRFPFDIQNCQLLFESFHHDSEVVQLEWFHVPVTVTKGIQLPDFLMTHYEAIKTKANFGPRTRDRLIVAFTFERRYGFYILQAYVPTYLTVFLSWISFVMEPKATAARASLGISALLALTFQLGNILSNLPRVSYIKALDVWIMGCISFLFATIAELTIVSHMEKRSQMNYKSSRQISSSRNSAFVNCCNFLTENPENVDKASLVLFPTVFAIFNGCYWYHYGNRK